MMCTEKLAAFSESNSRRKISLKLRENKSNKCVRSLGKQQVKHVVLKDMMVSFICRKDSLPHFQCNLLFQFRFCLKRNFHDGGRALRFFFVRYPQGKTSAKFKIHTKKGNAEKNNGSNVREIYDCTLLKTALFRQDKIARHECSFYSPPCVQQDVF